LKLKQLSKLLKKSYCLGGKLLGSKIHTRIAS